MKDNICDKLLLLAIALSTVFYSWISYYIFETRPQNFDEYSYLLQAQIFASGSLVKAVNDFSPLMIEPHVVFYQGVVFSKYFPGFSLLLSLAILLKVSFLLNPLLVSASLFFAYRLIQFFASKQVALIIVSLAAFVPYSFGYAASLFPQPLILFLSITTLWSFYSYIALKLRRYLLLIGILGAIGFLTRPIETICFLLPVSIGLLHSQGIKKGSFAIIQLGVLAAFGAIAVFAYSSYQMGFPALTTYVAPLNSELHLVGTLQEILTQFVVNFKSFFWYLLTDQFIYLIGISGLVLFVIGSIQTIRVKYGYVLLLQIFLVIFIYTFHSKDGWPQYGSRYWFAFFATFLVIAGIGWSAIQLRAGGWTKIIAGLLICTHILYLTYSIPEQLGRFQFRVEMFRIAKDNMLAKCPEKSLVFLTWREANPRVDHDRFIEDAFLRQNVISDQSRLIIGPYRDIDLDNILLQTEINQILARHQGYQLCRYQVNYN